MFPVSWQRSVVIWTVAAHSFPLSIHGIGVMRIAVHLFRTGPVMAAGYRWQGGAALRKCMVAWV